jgi:hypothetical protein
VRERASAHDDLQSCGATPEISHVKPPKLPAIVPGSQAVVHYVVGDSGRSGRSPELFDPALLPTLNALLLVKRIQDEV